MSESDSPQPMTPDEVRRIVREEIRKDRRDGGSRFTQSSVRLLLDQTVRTDATLFRIQQALLFLANQSPGSLPGVESYVARKIKAILLADDLLIPESGREESSEPWLPGLGH